MLAAFVRSVERALIASDGPTLRSEPAAPITFACTVWLAPARAGSPGREFGRGVADPQRRLGLATGQGGRCRAAVATIAYTEYLEPEQPMPAAGATTADTERLKPGRPTPGGWSQDGGDRAAGCQEGRRRSPSSREGPLPGRRGDRRAEVRTRLVACLVDARWPRKRKGPRSSVAPRALPYRYFC